MKCIPENSLLADGTVYIWEYDPATGVHTTTSVEDSNYPGVNALDPHPKNVAKATEVHCVYRLVSLTGGNALAIFNCPASEIRVKVINKESLEVVFDEVYSMSGIDTYQALVTDDSKRELSLFVNYPYMSDGQTIMIYVTGIVGQNSSCGVIWAGFAQEFEKLTYGLTETFKDYSEVSELNSGATYILERDIVRKFSFDVDMDSCDQDRGPAPLRRMFLEIGPNPVPWQLSDSGNEWTVFARKNSEPSGNYYSYKRVKASIELIEVL